MEYLIYLGFFIGGYFLGGKAAYARACKIAVGMTEKFYVSGIRKGYELTMKEMGKEVPSEVDKMVGFKLNAKKDTSNG